MVSIFVLAWVTLSKTENIIFFLGVNKLLNNIASKDTNNNSQYLMPH
jgi:hypothetical protein